MSIGQPLAFRALDGLGGAPLIRKFILSGSATPKGLTFRAAVGSRIEALEPGTFRIDNLLTVRVENTVEAVVVEIDGKQELRIPVGKAGRSERGSWQLQFEVEMGW